MEVPCTSTFWPTANTSVTGTAAPAAYLPAVSAVTRNSWMISPASTPALARWPASGLVTRDALREPNVNCKATQPSFSWVLTWVTRLLDTSTTVTGTASPSSVNRRIMPTLRPSNPRELLRLIGFLQNSHHHNFNWLQRFRKLSPACMKEG